MSNSKSIQLTGKSAYEAPRVTEEPLDSGGNYVAPTWPGGKTSADPDGSYGEGTLGNTPIE